MKKCVVKVVCLLIAVLLLSAPIQVLACACPESNLGGMQYYTSCSNGCWFRVCTVHGTEATGNHHSVGVSAHGKCVAHTCSYCSGCGVNECTTAHDPCGHGTCSHSCKTHHANHCVVCHQEPCACYPSASNISVPSGWFKQLTVNIASYVGATGHRIYDSSKTHLQTINGASCTFDVANNGTWYVRPFNGAGENPNFQQINITNIDHELPTVSPILGNPTDWTKDDVTITVPAQDAHSGLHPQAYSFDGGVTWQVSNEFTYAYNAVVDNIMVRDALENYISVPSFEINKIDKTTPLFDTATIPPSVSANGDSLLSYKIEDVDSGLTDTFELTTWAIKDKTTTTHTVTIPYATTNARALISNKKTAVFELGVTNNPHVAQGDIIAGEVIVTDLANNKSNYAIAEMMLDNIAPLVTDVKVSTIWNSSSNRAVITAKDNETSVIEWGFSTSKEKENIMWSTSNEYDITENNIYYAYAKDLNGNVSNAFEFKVSNVDKSTPKINEVAHSHIYTNGKYALTVNATDSGGGIASYGISTANSPVEWRAENKFAITKNGTYNFFAQDMANNVSTAFTVVVRYIDTEVPDLSYTVPTTWTNQNISISFKSNDSVSGIKHITMPDGTVSQNDAFSYKFLQNGTYSFTVTDNAGNSVTHDIVIGIIDKLKPKINYDIIESEADGTIKIIVVSTDTLSGINNIKDPNGKIHKGKKLEFSVEKNGEYIFTTTDIAGNIAEEKITVGSELLERPVPEDNENTPFAILGFAVVGVMGVAGTGAALSASAFSSVLNGSGGASVFLAYLFVGADAIAIDHKQSKKRRIKINDGIIDLTLAAEQAKTTHFTIIMNKRRYVRKNLGQVLKVVIDGKCITSCVLKEDTFKIVI